MPWTQVSIMDQRREFVALASSEGSNISALCRRFGISRQTRYKWLNRFDGHVDTVSERSRRPHCSPGKTSAAVEEAILSVRDAHPAWGARKIGWCLQEQGLGAPAVSTIHAILKRNDRIKPDRSHTHMLERFEMPAPNLLWQMDFKGQVQIRRGLWVHPLTVLDDHSRYSLCLAACRNERYDGVKALLENTFHTYGLPDAIYVDNGSPWGRAYGARPTTINQIGHWSRFGVWLLKLGVKTIYSRPYHPQGRGKNERFHRTLEAEVFALNQFDTDMQVQHAFDTWRSVYNTQRPHQALNMTVPASRYRVSDRAMPAKLPEVVYGPDDIVRRVSTTKAYISFKNKLWKVPKAFRGEKVALRPERIDGHYGVFFASTQIATVDLTA